MKNKIINNIHNQTDRLNKNKPINPQQHVQAGDVPERTLVRNVQLDQAPHCKVQPNAEKRRFGTDHHVGQQLVRRLPFNPHSGPSPAESSLGRNDLTHERKWRRVQATQAGGQDDQRTAGESVHPGIQAVATD